jgi:RNA polymerase sigma-70 factor (ECF subfamily)
MKKMDRAEEQRVIELAAAGDKDAAARLIRQHQTSLYAYILRLSGRPDVAEDVVQDAFVRVLTNLHRFDPKYRFSTWLFTIAKRLHVNACQKLKPVYDTDTVGAFRGDASEPIAPAMETETRNNARDALDRALLELSPDQREIVVLFYQHDWPIAQIAEYMSMPEGTIKSHLHRGRAKMRRAIERDAADGASTSEFLEVFS